MKKNWLLYLVIFSLALNLGTIGALVYFRQQDRRVAAHREPAPPLRLSFLLRSLQLSSDQQEALNRILPAHRRQVHQLQRELARKRQELFLLLAQTEPSSETIAVRIQNISAAQGELEKEMVQFLLQLKSALTAPQQQVLLEQISRRWSSRMEPAAGPPGTDSVCPSPAPGGRGRGRGGPGGPYQYPPPPPPPSGQ